MDPHVLRESVGSESTYFVQKPFSYKGMVFRENNYLYNAYTFFKDEEQSIYNAAMLFKSFTKDAKLSCTLSLK